MSKVEYEEKITWIRFGDQGPSVSNFLFAHDSLFLCENQSTNLWNILKEYGNLTGQTINVLKSFITFGEKVDSVIKRKTKDIFGIYAERGASTYRILECLGGSNVELLKYINK